VTVSIDEPTGFHEGDDSEVGGALAQTIPSWVDSPLDRMMTRELRVLLDEAIEKLPMDCRVVFVLRDIEGKSAEETARILRLSVPAVKSRLRRARVFLREQLTEYMTS
jgi:RNA polymerase sigma-70 factor (ECF subfamily)